MSNGLKVTTVYDNLDSCTMGCAPLTRSQHPHVVNMKRLIDPFLVSFLKDPCKEWHTGKPETTNGGTAREPFQFFFLPSVDKDINVKMKVVEDDKDNVVKDYGSLNSTNFTDLTGLLVRDTRRDSRQLSNFSSVMPERSSCTYSCDDSVHSCLLFLSPPYSNETN